MLETVIYQTIEMKSVTGGGYTMLDLPRIRPLPMLAEREGVTQSGVTRLLRLIFLAPDIVMAMLEGGQPVELTASKLLADTRVPIAWAEQRQGLGFK